MFKKIVWLGFNSKWKNAKDARKYVRELIDWWATEFFTGYNPPYWSDKFGFEVSPNGRFSEHEQITDLETLKIIVEEAHSSDIEVFINLNAWYYTDETFPLIERMLGEFKEANVDWIICWNIWILEYLKEVWYEWKMNISTIMAVYNCEAIKFLIENYCINKVILSREIALSEIEKILLEFPEMKFEVFGEWDFCRYNNGLCFAEHKYWARDICTVVVNDLIIKKRYNPAFKEIILRKDLSNFEKLELLNDEYLDDFEMLEKYFDELELVSQEEENDILEKIKKIAEKNKNNPYLYYDALKSPVESRNKKIITILKAVKLINNKFWEYADLKEELENNIKFWMKAFTEILRDLAWKTNVLAKDKDLLYNRNSNLNLHAYLFFSKFKNLDTVKFPTRWRKYTEKIQLITKVVEEQKVPEDAISLYDNIERTHYDMAYLFGDKLWYRNFLKSLEK